MDESCCGQDRNTSKTPARKIMPESLRTEPYSMMRAAKTAIQSLVDRAVSALQVGEIDKSSERVYVRSATQYNLNFRKRPL